MNGRSATLALRLLFTAALFLAALQPGGASTIASGVAPLMITGEGQSFALLPHCDAAPGELGFDRISAGTVKFAARESIKPASWPAVIWLRCFIRTTDPRDHRLWLITMGNSVDRVEFYEPTAEGYRMSISGIDVPFNERSDRYYFPALTLRDDTLSGRPLYMHVVYFQSVQLIANVRSEHRIFTVGEPYRLLEGVFFGVLLAVALFNLFVFFTKRDRTTILYVAYIVALTLNELVSTGIGDQYIWPNFAIDHRWAEWITNTAGFGTGLLFIRDFLQTRSSVPFWDRTLVALFFIEAATHLAAISSAQGGALIEPLLLIQFIAFVATAITAIVRWHQGFEAARFYAIGFIPAFIGIFANLAYDVFTPPGNWFWALNGVELGTMVQSILISFSLLDRIRILDRQKEEARAELTVVSEEALRLQDLALHDPLTGLANRMLFTEELGRALLRANRKNSHIGVLFADLDGFKPINDVYGHRVGDQVLRVVADRLQETLRKADLTCRLGGDEFAIIVEDLKSSEQAAQICETVGKLLDVPIIIDNTAMPLGISVGCSVYPQDGASVDQLLHNADLRMYAVKKAHKLGEDPIMLTTPAQDAN
ncbi:MAG: hypothetical protein NVSMB31_15660 [Vulcanimicrobiaceae bacterium]